MTDTNGDNKIMQPHFRTDLTDIWMRINPKIRILIQDHFRLQFWHRRRFALSRFLCLSFFAGNICTIFQEDGNGLQYKCSTFCFSIWTLSEVGGRFKKVFLSLRTWRQIWYQKRKPSHFGQTTSLTVAENPRKSATGRSRSCGACVSMLWQCQSSNFVRFQL